ncbi:MAG: hypothetical protein ACJ0OW_03825 [Flavobacteriaceae bacterium]|jgi:hypothetical protein|nr:hypothetical protein [Flavobacteriaceae bacterium]
MNRKISHKIRRVHRYLGLFLGLQFLMWTISGLYFSWTNLDEIHGDQFKNLNYQPIAFDSLISPSSINHYEAINKIEIRDIKKEPYFLINDSFLYNARTGKLKNKISQEDAIYIANNHMKEGLEISSIETIYETGKHHEYREKLLPAYVINYKSNENIKAYISIENAKFQTVRHRDWRWFDFLWMTHTMDYEGRDDFNNTVLRIFSLLGLITVMSGFSLWFVSSPTIRKFLN